MKFNPVNWNEVKPNETYEAQKGWLRLRLSAPCPLYLEAYGVEALVGVQTAFDVEISEAVTFRVTGPKDLRVFIMGREQTTHEPDGEVFTNIDRMSDESGSVLAVTQALRLFKLEQQASMREIRAERDQLRAEREKAEPEAAKEAKAVTEDVTE